MNESLGPPSLALLLLEARALGELGLFYTWRPLLKLAPRGEPHTVIVLPGMGAGDGSTAPLRGFLRHLGYNARGWTMGQNIGTPALIEPLVLRLRRLAAESGRKVSLIGWSLGGLYAREMAKLAPELVRSVITLGSPFKGPSRASNVARIYEYLSGAPAEDPEISARLAVPPPLPTTCIYTRGDGIVAWQRCVEAPGPETENIEVPGSHSGLGHNLLALYAIADRLAQREGQWRHFERRGWKRLAYRPGASDSRT